MLIEITLDIEKGEGRFSTVDNPITLRQQDAEAYVFSVSIRQGGEVLDLTGYKVRFYALKPDGTVVIDGDNVSVQSAPDGLVYYAVPKELTAVTGDIPTSYFSITSGDWSASTQNMYLRILPSVYLEATSSDYIPEIDILVNALEAQRVTYSNAEDLRESEWEAVYDEAAEARGRANSAADRCEAFLDSFVVEYSDLSDDLKQKIAAMASAGVEFATSEEIEEAFEEVIAPAIGADASLEGLTQEDYDYAMGKIFG